MDIHATDTVGSIVKQDIRAAKIFNNHNLEFCCDGAKPLELICKESNVSLDDVIRELRELEEGGDVGSPDFDSMELDDLTLYIENEHHKYTADSVSFIKLGLERLVRVHSITHPEVVGVKRIFDDMAGHLTVHMKKEELMLFPFVRKLARFGGEAMKRSVFETVAEPIRAMRSDHDHEGEKLRELERLTDNFKIPKDGCETFSATYSAIKELKMDLHVHIHLENNILFPKAIALESNHRQRLSGER